VAKAQKSSIPRHVGLPSHKKARRGPVIVKVELKLDSKKKKNPQHKIVVHEVDATKTAKRNPARKVPIVKPAKREINYTDEQARKVREPVNVKPDTRHNKILCSLCKEKFKHIKTFIAHSCLSLEN